MLQIVECPRDAMQGIKTEIPTALKIEYINAILGCGFHTVDFGSFVSPKAIPQMADTKEVLRGLDLDATNSKLLAIIANARGAEDAASHDEIGVLGYPFSISETFQMRNTNAGIEASLKRVEEIAAIAGKRNKELVLYLSMAFGNPYGDPWSPEIAMEWTLKINALFGINIIALSDTIGSSTPELIASVFGELIPALPQVTFGAHLHTTPSAWQEKVEAAYGAGCRRFDGALKGFGGCPMATDELTGNMPTERMLSWFDSQNIPTGINNDALSGALIKAAEVFH